MEESYRLARLSKNQKFIYQNKIYIYLDIDKCFYDMCWAITEIGELNLFFGKLRVKLLDNK